MLVDSLDEFRAFLEEKKPKLPEVEYQLILDGLIITKHSIKKK